MPPRSRQLTFALDPEPHYSAEDFLVTSVNGHAFALVTSWPSWPARALLLTGPAGSGKTHLASIFAGQSGASLIHGADLNAESLLSGDIRALAVDDADAGSDRALFHLLNAAREQNFWLLLTTQALPHPAWPRLPDLSSRLRALPHAELAPPDDALLRAVLVKLFVERQLNVEADVVDYIARRMERSLAAARHLIAALDAESLALGRRVTKPIAAEVLSRFTETED